MKNMISRRNFLAAAGVVAAAGVLTACGGSSSSTAAASGSTAAAASGDTIKVGVMGPHRGRAGRRYAGCQLLHQDGGRGHDRSDRRRYHHPDSGSRC